MAKYLPAGEFAPVESFYKIFERNFQTLALANPAAVRP
jgi:hypothetical protein